MKSPNHKRKIDKWDFCLSKDIIKHVKRKTTRQEKIFINIWQRILISYVLYIKNFLQIIKKRACNPKMHKFILKKHFKYRIPYPNRQWPYKKRCSISFIRDIQMFVHNATFCDEKWWMHADCLGEGLLYSNLIVQENVFKWLL